MANNYLMFSEGLILESVEERTWLQEQLEEVEVFAREDDPDDRSAWLILTAGDSLPDGKCDSVFAGPRFLLDFDCDEDQAVCGFDCEFEEGEDEDAPGHVVFHADECGSPERLAHLVQTYLRRFHPDRSWALSWSVTCSKLRVGEFGGGGVLVTAERLCWVNTWEFLEEQADRFEKIGRCEPHGEHPQFPRADWGRAVGEGQTVLGYWGWVVARLTALEPDDSPE